MSKKTASSTRLLLNVQAEIERGRIAEAFISEDGFCVDGLIEGQQITINPVHQIVDTLVHEILHRLYPNWEEAYVRNRTKYLRNRMDDQEVLALYQVYCQTAVKRKRVKKI